MRWKSLVGALLGALLTCAALAQPNAISTPATGLQAIVPGPGSLPGPSLDLNFITGRAIDPRISFTRASSATYFDATGTMQTAGSNVPRIDWGASPGSAPLGLLIEEARTNLWLQSANAANAAWGLGGVGGTSAPVATANQTTAPDGTLTAASIAYPAVSGAGHGSNTQQAFVVTANQYAFSVYLKGSVGGETLYLSATPNGTLYYQQAVTLTTAWQRFTLVTSALTATSWFFEIGTDLRNGSESATPAQTIYVWGGQLEQGAFATSYIPTSGSTATRAADVATMPVGSWFNPAALTWAAEFSIAGNSASGAAAIIGDAASGKRFIYVGAASPYDAATYDGSVVQTANSYAANVAVKAASTWVNSVGQACLNAGAVASGAMATGFASVATVGLFSDSSTSDRASGYLRRARYWPRALSSLELQQVTK